MNAIVLAQKASDWNRLKALVLDSVSSTITRRVYNLGLLVVSIHAPVKGRDCG
jgi:hypothetical protein